MKITVAKVKRELQEKYGYNLENGCLLDKLIKDIISIINNELLKHKKITIKK